MYIKHYIIIIFRLSYLQLINMSSFLSFNYHIDLYIYIYIKSEFEIHLSFMILILSTSYNWCILMATCTSIQLSSTNFTTTLWLLRRSKRHMKRMWPSVHSKGSHLWHWIRARTGPPLETHLLSDDMLLTMDYHNWDYHIDYGLSYRLSLGLS